jgi:hypothetical protein
MTLNPDRSLEHSRARLERLEGGREGGKAYRKERKERWSATQVPADAAVEAEPRRAVGVALAFARGGGEVRWSRDLEHGAEAEAVAADFISTLASRLTSTHKRRSSAGRRTGGNE